MFDRLSKKVRAKIESFDESGMGYWRIKAFLRDGRAFANVYITDRFTLGFPGLTPFQLRDIEEVEWDGYRGKHAEGAPVELRR
ncbi:MAG TPA: hypothetical protein VIG04_07490 [Gemmatimonadales bacterium]